MGSRISSSERDLETPSEFAPSITLWWLVASVTSQKERWTCGLLIVLKRLERLSHLAQQKSIGQHVEGLFLLKSCMSVWKLITISKSSELTDLKFWRNRRLFKSSIKLSGNLMKQVCSQNQTLTSSERKRRKVTQISQRESSNLAKVERIARFNRWWDNRWPVVTPQTNQLEKLIRTSTKNCKLNKPKRLSKLFCPRTTLALTSMRTPLEQELPPT